MKKLLFIPLTLILILSCSGTAIFYTLENEEEIRDTNNFKPDTPVNKILIYKDAAGTETYITHGKQLWYSTAGTQQNPWAAVSIPDGFSTHVVVSSIATFGTRLYATLIDDDRDSKSALMYMDSVSGVLNEVFSYTRRDGPGSDDYFFYDMSLFYTDDGLYISRVNRSWNTESSDSSSIEDTELFYFPSGDYPSASGLDAAHQISLPGMTLPFLIKDIVSTGAGGDTYLILNEAGSSADSYAAGKLFKATNSPSSFSEISMDDAYSYNRLYYSEKYSALFISTRTKSDVHPILYSLSGGPWLSLPGKSDVQFSGFADISDVQDKTILVGTRGDVQDGSSSYYNGDGYYEIDMTDPSSIAIQGNTFALDTNYKSTDLTNSTIMDILYDKVRNKIYTSTSSNGLWMNKYSESDDARIWYIE
ncbi:hypothetical protein [Oceanispirochaeta sp.]|jgi:hypothetical protein|uniref:hypothetical protein n=1 Tax=Oceanispirochaeta sp. TaxID=2035350 RepID=UPI00261D4719|nr:hypothetical protein [Oceanispirochaeta sp.]MDA3956902.1 hypothetical protein [Oceanispirochaeta sp.]